MARNALTPYGGYPGDWNPFLSLHREMSRLFDDVYRVAGGASTPGSAPIDARIDVSETDRALRVRAELPGVDEKDIDITLDNDTLTIRGEKRFQQQSGDDKESYHFVERSYGVFQRTLKLPQSVSPDEVRADFRNGLLTITIPKSGQQQRSRRIQIGQGQTQEQTSGQTPAAVSGAEREDRSRPPERSAPSGQGEQPRAH